MCTRKELQGKKGAYLDGNQWIFCQQIAIRSSIQLLSWEYHLNQVCHTCSLMQSCSFSANMLYHSLVFELQKYNTFTPPALNIQWKLLGGRRQKGEHAKSWKISSHATCWVLRTGRCVSNLHIWSSSTKWSYRTLSFYKMFRVSNIFTLVIIRSHQ